MPNALVCLFIIAIGSFVLVVAWNGYKCGELPAGCNGLKAYRPNRDDNPFGFHFYLCLYFLSGMSLITWGLFSLLGTAGPIPLS